MFYCFSSIIGCFLPDLFLAAYSAGYRPIQQEFTLRLFLAAYSAGYLIDVTQPGIVGFLAAYSAGYNEI